jgi:hypothetical protein
VESLLWMMERFVSSLLAMLILMDEGGRSIIIADYDHLKDIKTAHRAREVGLL